jgi:hypothetical protein
MRVSQQLRNAIVAMLGLSPRLADVRAGGVFGSGGPRAIQVAVRATF